MSYREDMRQYKKDMAFFKAHVQNDPKLGPMAKNILMPQPPVNPKPRVPTASMDKELQAIFGK